MPLPIYIKAEKYCNRIQEMHHLYQELVVLYRASRATRHIRSYVIDFGSYSQVSQKDRRSGSDIEKILYSTSLRKTTNYQPYADRHGGFQITNIQLDWDKDLLIRTPEGEFQNLMLYNEYELFKMYITETLHKFYHNNTREMVVYLASTDTSRYTAANKALKELIDAARN